MELFILNDVDYTQHIMVPSYKVQREEVTKEWEDALYQNHVDLLRYRLEGSFTIYFDVISEFFEFLDTLENMRGTDNYIEATLYDNKTHSLKTSKFQFTVTLQNDLPYYQVERHNGYNIQVKEK